MIYSKFQIKRTEPKLFKLPVDIKKYPQGGDVVITINALDCQEIKLHLSLSDWSKALAMKPVTAWIEELK